MKSIEIEIDDDRFYKWAEWADERGQTMQEFIIGVVDKAIGTPLPVDMDEITGRPEIVTPANVLFYNLDANSREKESV